MLNPGIWLPSAFLLVSKLLSCYETEPRERGHTLAESDPGIRQCGLLPGIELFTKLVL